MQSNLVCLRDDHEIFYKVICLFAKLLVKIHLYFFTDIGGCSTTFVPKRWTHSAEKCQQFKSILCKYIAIPVKIGFLSFTVHRCIQLHQCQQRRHHWYKAAQRLIKLWSHHHYSSVSDVHMPSENTYFVYKE